MVITLDGTSEKRRWTPRSDFSVWIKGFPRLVVEICTNAQGQIDRSRMLLSAASVVRLANHILRNKNLPSNFVLVAIYMFGMTAELHLVYEKGVPSKVS